MRAPRTSRPSTPTTMRRFLGLTACHALAAICLCAMTTRVPVVSAQSGVGFRFDVGRQDLGGEWGRVMEGALDGEVGVLYGVRGLRLGGALSWTSMRVVGEARKSWHHTAGLLFLGYGRTVAPRLRPFGEVRYVRWTARPEGSRLFDEEAAKEPIGPFRAEGDGFGARLGVEILLSDRVALSLSHDRQWFGTAPDPVDQGLGSVRRGTSRRFGAGLTWFHGEGSRDGSGGVADEPTLGLAVGVGSLGLLVPWTWNEHLKGKPFTAVSPRSWRRGVTNGFAWDDNDFDVNYHRHPYHGYVYFGAARANGYGFGRSLVHAVVGSYLWECCTETHIASIPDMVTTVVGGAAYGESIHRMSSRILDDSATGVDRVLRETAAAVVDPARGVTRLASGRSWRAGSGRGSGEHGAFAARLQAGARSTIGESGARRWLPYLAATWTEGDPLGPGQGPFSFHRVRVGLHPGDRFTIGQVAVRGALWRGDVRGGEGMRSRFSASLDIDYVSTWAYRFAAQGLVGGWSMASPLGERTRVELDAEVSLVLMGSVDSEYARLAEIRGVRERLRGYDFGVGPGARLAVGLKRRGEDLIRSYYRVIDLETLNGSNVDGNGSRHVVHLWRTSLGHRVAGGFGLGAELDVFVRDSRYEHPAFIDSLTRRAEGRVFLSWRPTPRD